jgi:GTP-binding protein
MFIDRATIKIKSGDGGDGAVQFHREKYVAFGGPSGGDGGQGGSVLIEATHDLSTLLDFRFKKEFEAEAGADGMSKNRHGRGAKDVVIRVPVGTVVYDADSGAVLADLSQAGERFLAAPGGKGGRGNARFASPTNRAPTTAERGELGVQRNLRLELKLLADVGLVGFPNAGKSTLISVISAAKPKIADYPFTTLEPQLGVVRLGDDSVVVADIPGLIEGAHAGAGLGHEFLRHVERTRMLLHVLDLSGGPEERDPLQDWEVINTELKAYSPELAARPMAAVLNKIDLPKAQENLDRVRVELENKGFAVFPVSAATRAGIQELLNYVHHRISQLPPPPAFIPEAPEAAKPVKAFELKRQDRVWVVTGVRIERMVEHLDPDDPESLYRLERTLSKLGVYDALTARGVKDGDTVRVGPMEFTYVE